MTKQNKKNIKGIKKYLKNKKIINFQYVEEEDYFVITLENNYEFSFRFMADLV